MAYYAVVETAKTLNHLNEWRLITPVTLSHYLKLDFVVQMYGYNLSE